MASTRYKRKSYRKIKGRKNRITRRKLRGGLQLYRPCNLSYDFIKNAANLPNHGYR